MIHIGIDTSNYKTSLAAVDDSGRILANISEYLDVQRGEKGLRQSDAFFKHSNKLPDLLSQLLSEIDKNEIADISVSSRPRRVEGSYMPCFRAGINLANVLSDILRVPVYEFSHQEGHAAAIIENSSDTDIRRSVLFHLSGGTTEFLICEPDEDGYRMEICGGTKDISAGQLIDRAGVAMGYPFPSGAYLDDLAETYYAANGRVKSGLPRIKTSDGQFNLSGTETQVMRMIEASAAGDYPQLAYSIFERIAELLASSAVNAAASAGTDTVYMAGGVSSSSFIRRSIAEKTGRYPEIIFGDPVLSGDNAVGTARLARRIHNR